MQKDFGFVKSNEENLKRVIKISEDPKERALHYSSLEPENPVWMTLERLELFTYPTVHHAK